MEECVFCKIIAGEISAEKVYEDTEVVAFLDLHPVNPGHTLVVPRSHVEQWQEMEEDLAEQVMRVARNLGRTMKTKLNPLRVGLWVEGLDVPHAHMHVCPLLNINDLRTKRTAEDMQKPADTKALAAVAEKLRS